MSKHRIMNSICAKRTHNLIQYVVQFSANNRLQFNNNVI